MNPGTAAKERPGVMTFKGRPMSLYGPELKVGDKAPDFEVVNKTLEKVTLENTGNTVRIFSVVPSIDTRVCDMQTKRFNEEAAKLPNAKIYTISMDLPFAQDRWCTTFCVDNLVMLSDHKDASFGNAYGTLIKDWRIESRAIFVVDKDNIIRHVEYVKEMSEHPDYEAALRVARQLAS
jgi:thiol peroxidase